MDGLFIALMLISMLGIIVSLIVPRYTFPFLTRKRRLKAVGTYAGLTILFFILFGVTAPPSSPSLAPPSNQTATISANATTAGSISNTVATVKAKTGSNAVEQSATKDVNKSSSTSSGPTLIPVVVSKETDGDTIHVTMPNGEDKTIRMLLIDTPEDVKPGTPVEPYSLQAAAFAKQELPVGKHIYIQEGKPGYTTDKYGRLLAYVFVTKTDMYNEDVVKKGLARVAYIYPPNTDYLSTLDADQSYAKSHKLGIWSIPGYVTPDGYNVNDAKPNTSTATTTKQTTTKKPATTTSPSKGTTSSALTLVSFTQDVTPGEYATITVHGVPGTTADIDVEYKSGPSTAKGLGEETVGSDGDVTWTWKVGTNTSAGSWPVDITDDGHSLQETLQVS